MMAPSRGVNDDPTASDHSVVTTRALTTPQTYLLGFEFPSTLILFWKSSRKVTFVCSSSKG